jgi:hypothetical protein
MSRPPISIDMPEVVVSALVVSCDIAAAGAAMPNVPPMIAKAATNAAIMLVLIEQRENTIDLKDLCENSLISFAACYTLLLHGNL